MELDAGVTDEIVGAVVSYVMDVLLTGVAAFNATSVADTVMVYTAPLTSEFPNPDSSVALVIE